MKKGNVGHEIGPSLRKGFPRCIMLSSMYRVNFRCNSQNQLNSDLYFLPLISNLLHGQPDYIQLFNFLFIFGSVTFWNPPQEKQVCRVSTGECAAVEGVQVETDPVPNPLKKDEEGRLICWGLQEGYTARGAHHASQEGEFSKNLF